MLRIEQVIGITIGSTVGAVILVFILYKLIRWWRRQGVAYEPKFDLEQPFTKAAPQGSHAKAIPMLGLPPVKESELVASPNVAVQLDDLDMLAMNGLPVVNVAALPKNGLQPSGAGKQSSIMRWLETAQGPSTGAAADQAGAKQEGAALPPQPSMRGRLSALSMRALSDRFQAADLMDMRKRLLAAGAGGFGGDSSSAYPLDIKGIVFNRLPPSRRASPAPSTIDASVARTPRISRDVPANGSHLAEQVQQVSTPRVSRTNSATRTKSASPAVPLGSHAGLSFSSIGALARNSLKRSDEGGSSGEGSSLATEASLPPRVPRVRSNLGQSHDSGLPTVLLSQPSSLQGGVNPFASPMAGQPVAVARNGYQQAMGVLEQAAGYAAPQQGHHTAVPILPVSIPAAEGAHLSNVSMANPVYHSPTTPQVA